MISYDDSDHEMMKEGKINRLSVAIFVRSIFISFGIVWDRKVETGAVKVLDNV